MLYQSVIKVVLTFSLAGSIANSASFEDDRGLGYEAIVEELSRTETRRPSILGVDSLSTVKIHGGAGIQQTFFPLTHRNGSQTPVAQTGVSVTLGIDLFSSHWKAEGSLTSFGLTQYSSSQVSIRDFALKLIHHDLFSRNFGYRISSGIMARYIDERYTGEGGTYQQNWQLPSGLLGIGPEVYLGQTWSVGFELMAHSSMVDQSPTSTSADFGIRLDGHF